MKLKCIHLVGVPGAGKSTWIKTQTMLDNFVVVSTDNFVEQHAKEVGKTYSEVFDDYIKVATRLMDNQVLIAKANNCDIIWDQTNLTAKSRKAKLAKLDGYEKIAVFFHTPEPEVLAWRLENRPGKTIPWKVITDMSANIVEPTEEEGFKEIWYV
jgi:predicted kinase